MSDLKQQLSEIKKEWTLNEIVAVILTAHTELSEVFLCINERSNEFFEWFEAENLAEQYCDILGRSVNEPFTYYKGVRNKKVETETAI